VLTPEKNFCGVKPQQGLSGYDKLQKTVEGLNL